MGIKIYTKKGDKGFTSLVNSKKVLKSDPRIQCYGLVDELNSIIGVVLSFLSQEQKHTLRSQMSLTKIQNELFNLGSQLACSDIKISKKLPDLNKDQIDFLEQEIDELQTQLDPLKNFILPGGSLVGSHLHLARTSCRNLERTLVQNKTKIKLNITHLVYINRLSDYFFVLSRFCNKELGSPEILWTK